VVRATVHYRVRAAAAALVVSIVCLFSILDSMSESSQGRGDKRDGYGAGRTIERMAEAQGLLPPGARVLYLSDVGRDNDAGTLAFLTAQHALAPRLLVPPDKAKEADWAIGNFASPRADFRSYGEAQGFEIVRNCGGGVVVYRKKGQ
jgi:hypothetical protein